mmetsp:Transcript_26198/g.37496  ORF Transcript_26198/g.37496 Transcript_26198/m.37496 type:complete len:225 (+) Transcript_26198:816-1490(+)
MASDHLLSQYWYVFEFSALLIQTEPHRPSIFYGPFSTKLAFEEVEQVGVDLRAVEVALLEHPDSACLRGSPEEEEEEALLEGEAVLPSSQGQEAGRCQCVSRRARRRRGAIERRLWMARLGVLLSLLAALCFSGPPLLAALQYSAGPAGSEGLPISCISLLKWVLSTETRRVIAEFSGRILSEAPQAMKAFEGLGKGLLGSILAGKAILFVKAFLTQDTPFSVT